MADEYVAVARVQVLVEIDTGPYGKEWTLEAIHKDAEDRAIERLRCTGLEKTGAKIVNIIGVHQVIAKKKA